jgi:hypothetical protein
LQNLPEKHSNLIRQLAKVLAKRPNQPSRAGASEWRFQIEKSLGTLFESI